ncbi:MAG: HAMP domain-containing histidine kinase [Acidobacteria bacterium]|nr:HAMP domain-containing histidine kinase [Acidobacteriota bacterium]
MSRRFRLPRHTLFWKFYFYGLGLLLAVAVAGGVVAHLVGKTPPWIGAPDRLAGVLSRALQRGPGEAAGLKAHVEEIGAVLNVDIAVYDAQGALLAASGPRAPGRLDPRRIETLPSRDFPFRQSVLPLLLADGRRVWTVLRWEEHGGIKRHFWTVAVVFVLLAVMPWLFARTFIRPLERLTRTAKAFGDGDLRVRAALKRCDEIGRLAGAFDEMADRVAGLVRSEKELLANLSHEVRTPLARIRVALELCGEDEADGEAVRARLPGIETDLAELEGLVEHILALTRLDLAAGGGAAAQALAHEAVDLASLVEAAAARFKETWPGHPLAVDTPGPLPKPFGDARFLRRVLDNLLDNAARYSPEGSPVEIAVEPGPAGVAVAVRDRGEGIPEADRERVFEPFFRGDRSRTPGRSGVGLGLTLCRRVVEAAGGRIEALPREGGGAEIRFTLPLHPDTPQGTPKA